MLSSSQFDPDRAFSPRPAPPGRVFSVSEVTGAIRDILELSFPAISVRGEISNLSRPQSGHVYFSLVDDAPAGEAAGGGREPTSRLSRGQLACVIWRSAAARVRAPLENGARVVATGRIGVYEPRGCYQLIVQRVDAVGRGDLQRQFEELKERLRNEGLFRPERKRPLPFLPGRIGLVTSPSGAAIQDVLRALYRRHPRAWVRVVPVRVQGEGAAAEMVRALETLQSGCGQVDVILLTRGGGSLEDLWAFNDEGLARAMASCRIPTVSAVGHETDFCISDFVADVRAQTPTKAAEILVPDVAEILERLRTTRRRTALALDTVMERRRLEIGRILRSRSFRRPGVLVEGLAESCDDVLRDLMVRAGNVRTQLGDAVRGLSLRLEALNPRNVLSRGYSLTTDSSGRIVTDAATLSRGDELRLELARGRAGVRVESAEAE